MTCAEIKDCTIDFLYGELPQGERASFEAHLQTCDACRAEVAGLQGTLHRARAAVRVLEESPPSRVRASVLAAAHAAAASASSMASAPVAAAARLRRPGDEPKTASRAGWLDWLRRPWMIPLGVVATAAVVMLVASGVVLNRKAVEDQLQKAAAPSAVAPRPVSAPVIVPEGNKAEAPPPSPAAERLAPTSAGDERLKAMPASSSVRHELAKRKAPARSLAAEEKAERGFAAPPPPRPRENEAQAKDKLDNLLDSALSGGGRRDRGAGSGAGALGGVESEGAPADLERQGGKADKQVGVLGNVDRKTAPVARKSSETAGPVVRKPSVASAPPPAAAPEASAAAPAPRAYAPAPKAAPVPVPASPPAAPTSRRAPPAQEPSRYQEADDALEGAPVSAKKAKGRALSPLEEQVQKADRLFTAARWAEAADVYRELLRKYPDHESARVWRGRLRACEQALQRPQAAPPAAAKQSR